MSELKLSWVGEDRILTASTTKATNLEDVLAIYEDFLRAIGFVFEGHLTIEEQEK